MATTVPEGYGDLLERPVVGVLSTVGADGVPNATPMWFQWDGTYLRFTHTKARRKIRNLQGNPNYSFVITDPDNPYRYLEVRGTLESVETTRRDRSTWCSVSGTATPTRRHHRMPPTA